MNGQMLELVTIVTWIPLYPPFAMMNLSAANPAPVEMLGATLLLLWSAGGVFRPKLARVLLWIRSRADA